VDILKEVGMATAEERLTTLEKTVALLQRQSSSSVQELNRNVTMLLGVVSSQQMDIKEIKISQLLTEERLDTIEQRLTSLETTMQAGFAEILARLPAKA